MTRPLCQNALDLIRHCEGVVLQVYLDSVGIPTAGVGHVIRAADGDYRVGDPITQERADLWLQDDLASAAGAVDRYMPDLATENARGALASFCFNEGAVNLRQLIADSDSVPAQIAERFSHYTRARNTHPRGLKIRRALERDLFLAPDGPMPDGWLVKHDAEFTS